jgi:hypothetical protein
MMDFLGDVSLATEECALLKKDMMDLVNYS